MKLEAMQRLLGEKEGKQEETTAGPQYIPRWHTGNQLTLDTGLEDALGDSEAEAMARLLK